MTKKTRYFLLFTCVAFFLIAAPLIVLYVRGVTYDFAKKTFVQTGIFSIRSQPSDAQVFLDGQLKRNSAGDINFLVPDEYQITLQKAGYQNWSKRLGILPGQVTVATPPTGSIYLMLKAPISRTLATGTLDFYQKDNLLLAITGQNRLLTATNGSFNGNGLALTKPVNQIVANVGGNNFILAGTATGSGSSLLYFNAATSQITDLSGLFAGLPKFQFSPDGDLYALSSSTLFQINLTATTKTPVLLNVKTFYFQDDSLYYIQNSGNIFSLYISQPPFSQSQLLRTNLPNFTEGDLLVTFEKQIFLLADGSLYLTNNTMEKITDGISQINLGLNDGAMSIFHSGELDYLDYLSQNLNFITRSSQPLKNLSVKTNIGYAFYSNSNGINAIELDARDNQNQYALYTSGTVQKFTVDGGAQNIFLLDDGVLKSLKIR